MKQVTSFTLHRVKDKAKLNLFDLVTDMTLNLSVSEASTLVVELHDPQWTILTNGWFDKDGEGQLDAIDVRLFADDTLWFRLVQVSAQAESLSLTFEDRNIAYLRHKRKELKVDRDKATRAEFIQWLVKSVDAVDLGFYCPELHKVQPIATPQSADDKADRDSDRQPGFASGVKLKGKEGPLSQQALDNAEIVLNEAARLNAGPKATKALVEACIIEAPDFANPSGGDATSVGILQLLSSHLGGSTSTKGGRRDIALVCKLFLTEGFTDGVGAIEYAKKNPQATAGQVAQHCQGSAHPDRYDGVSSQADDIIDAFGGASGSGTVTEEKVTYTVGKNEDFWTAMRRMADDVTWRLFSADNKIYFADDFTLLRARSQYELDATGTAVVDRSFTWDSGGDTPNEFAPTVFLKDTDLKIGTVINVINAGPCDGRWLTTAITYKPLDMDAPVGLTLNLPVASKKEPAPETTSEDGEASSSGSGGLRDKIVSEARASQTSKTGFRRYTMDGSVTKANDPTPATGRTDCSSWVDAIYRKAGAPSPGSTTVQQLAKGKRTTSPKPGDLVLDPAGTRHVELYVGDGKTIGHGSAPIDPWTTDDMRAHFGGIVYVTFDFLDD